MLDCQGHLKPFSNCLEENRSWSAMTMSNLGCFTLKSCGEVMMPLHFRDVRLWLFALVRTRTGSLSGVSRMTNRSKQDTYLSVENEHVRLPLLNCVNPPLADWFHFDWFQLLCSHQFPISKRKPFFLHSVLHTSGFCNVSLHKKLNLIFQTQTSS